MFSRERINRVSVATAIMFAAAMFALAIFPATVAAQDFEIKFNFGLERGDYKDFDLAQPSWELCRNACAAESACLAFTYTIPIAGPNGRPAHCWLKNVVNRGEGRDWCISGIKKAATAFSGLSGMWKGESLLYQFEQNGWNFTWRVTNDPNNPETAQGQILGSNRIRASYSGTNGSATLDGTVLFDTSGRPVRINWDNGAVFTRQ